MLPLVYTFDGGERFEALFMRWADKRHTVRLQGGWDVRGLGRYTILGFDPHCVLFAWGDQIHRELDGHETRLTGDPFRALDVEYTRLSNFSLRRDYPVPFQGGALGYLGYELRHWASPGLSSKARDVAMPDMYFAFYDIVCVFDNVTRRGYVFSSGLPERGSAAKKRARRRLDEVCQTLEGDIPASLFTQGGEALNTHGCDILNTVDDEPEKLLRRATSSFTQDAYMDAVRRAKEYIFSGQIYQVNLSQRFAMPALCAPSTLFQSLQKMNPSPLGAYVKGPDWAVISVSPERFFRYDGTYVETRPIKGTRPRGRTPADDAAWREQLIASAKDRAEHAMIVDLARSDLGRFCAYRSVEVVDFMVCEAHPTVWHLVSTVRGIPKPQTSIIEAIRTAFPGSSITGTPKVQAMEIIDELEPMARGIYTGAMGYIGLGGTVDLNIAIRTVCHVDGTAYFHVGGAVVADSDPLEEYKETLVKGVGIARGIAAATEGGGYRRQPD